MSEGSTNNTRLLQAIFGINLATFLLGCGVTFLLTVFATSAQQGANHARNDFLKASEDLTTQVRLLNESVGNTSKVFERVEKKADAALTDMKRVETNVEKTRKKVDKIMEQPLMKMFTDPESGDF